MVMRASRTFVVNRNTAITNMVSPCMANCANPSCSSCCRFSMSLVILLRSDGDEGQPHVRGEQKHRDNEHGQSLYGELRQPILQQLLQILDVARHPAPI